MAGYGLRWYVCVACIAAVSCGAVAVTLTPVAFEGDPLPGSSPGGFEFLTYPFISGDSFAPQITTAGEVGFFATIADPPDIGGTGAGSLWAGVPGSLRVPVRGLPQASLNGGIYTSIDYPKFNDAGSFAFYHRISGGTGTTSANAQGISFAPGDGGAHQVVARRGESAPGLPAGYTFNSLESTAESTRLNDADQVAFLGQTQGPFGRRDGVWRWTDGQLELIAATGQAAGSLPGDPVLQTLFSPTLNDSGQAAFKARVDNRDSIVVGTPGNLAYAAGPGVPVPGLIGLNQRWLSLETNPAINGLAHVAFQGRAVSDTEDIDGIWVGPAGGLSLRVLNNTQAPGTEPGVTYRLGINGEDSAVLNDRGDLAFFTGLNNTTSGRDTAIYLAEAGQAPGLLAREGDPAPGTDGLTFNAFNSVYPALNQQGHLVFNGSAGNRPGVWAWDGDALVKVIQEGDVVDIDPDPDNQTLRTVAQYDFAGDLGLSETIGGGGDGKYRLISDDGELAVAVRFTDGEVGVFIASLFETLTGDYSGDGFVSQADLDLVLLSWGDGVLPAGFGEGAIPGGGPFDGLVSQNELDGVLLSWGDGTAPSFNVIPEPGVGAAFVALLGLAARRRC
ncbi:MAG: choice-of-anchor tandem repeat NxxGxxAF-containing protein [Planctomycetota bacterium]